jgi:hypothetical protein
MNSRNILIVLVSTLAIVGVALAAVPFISSMNPSMKAREEAKILVDISSIPENGVLEVDFRGNKVFLIRKPQITAYWFPYWDGAYRLPDPTWERAIIPCKKIETDATGFYCTDRDLHESWREIAHWDLEGKAASKWMPNLKTIPFRVQGDAIVFSPEYRK